MSVAGAQEFSVEISATPLECFNAILDFERYPQWSSAIQDVAVIERDAHGVGRIVEFRIDMKFKSIRYVLDYTYRKPTTLTWRSVDGDIEAIEGQYTFEKIGAGRTLVTCRQAITIGFWVPGPIRKLLERTALQQSVMEFKAEVERRQTAQPAKAKAAARGRRKA
jgi:ribosome-associated toxin RatA of RatAB toxin-antitoxin module